MTAPVRVLVVDDHPLFREGLRSALGGGDGVEVVGEAVDAESALALAAELVPDVVLMDLRLPGTGGVEATRALRARLPGCAVVVLTMLDDDHAVTAALRAGASGYLLKGADREEIRRAVTGVARGDFVLGTGVAGRVRDWFAGPAVLPFPGLTDREREVLGLVARGLTNAEIARRLVVSDKTVRNTVSNVLAKIGARDRAAAVAAARDAGLGLKH